MASLHGLFHKWGEWRTPEPLISITWWPLSRSRAYSGVFIQMRYCTQCNRVDWRELDVVPDLDQYMKADRIPEIPLHG